MKIIMRQNRQHSSKLWASITIVLCAIALWLLSGWLEFQKRQEQVFHQAEQSIEREIKLLDEYVTSLMRSLGGRIIEDKSSATPTAIQHFVRQALSDNNMAREFLYVDKAEWTPFVTNKPQLDLEEAVKADPWVLYFSPPRKADQQQYGVPVEMSVRDKSDKAVGMLSAMLNVSRINQRLASQMEKNAASFLVLDKAGNTVFYSDDRSELSIAQRQETQKYFTTNKAFLPDQRIRLTLDKVTYSHAFRPYHSPFVILLGYPEKIAQAEWMNAFLWNSTVFFVLLAMAAALLVIWLMRYMIAEPAEKVSRDLHQLLENEVKNGAKIQYLVSKEDMPKPLLEGTSKIQPAEREEFIAEAIRIVDEVDRARDWLNRELLQRLQEPTEAIINGLRLAKEEALGPLDKETYGKYIYQMYEAAQMLENYTSALLKPEEVDIQEILHKCTIMQRKDALKSRVRVELVVKKKIPRLYADPLRLRQVLISTIYQSIAYLAPYRTVTIAADYEKTKEGKPASLSITIADNGLGFNIEAREGAKNPYLAPKKPYDFMRLDIAAIQYLIRLHQGHFEMITRCGVGTSFVIRLPYLSKESLEATMHEPEANWKALRMLESGMHKNVLSFPGGKKD